VKPHVNFGLEFILKALNDEIMKTLVALLALTALVASCATYKDVPASTVLDKTIGKSEHDIILTLGPPQSITEDGAGGKVLNYQNSFSFTNTELNPVRYDPTITTATTQNITYYLQFYINKDGKVYHYRTNYPPIRVKVKNASFPSPIPPPPNPFARKTDTSRRSS
jgi:hypothetical protein